MSLSVISAWNYSCSVWIARRRVSGPFRLLSLFNVCFYPFLLLWNININQKIKTWTFLHVYTLCLTWWVTHGPRRSAQMIIRLKSCCLGHLWKRLKRSHPARFGKIPLMVMRRARLWQKEQILFSSISPHLYFNAVNTRAGSMVCYILTTPLQDWRISKPPTSSRI